MCSPVDSERSELMMRAVYGWPASTKALLVLLPLLALAPRVHAQPAAPSPTPPPVAPAPAQSVTYPPPAAAPAVTPAPGVSTTAEVATPAPAAAVSGSPNVDVSGAEESPNDAGKLDWD